MVTYLVFSIVLMSALFLDLGILSKKSKVITIKKAFYQTLMWVGIALAFGIFLWVKSGYDNHRILDYISAYLMEWSLSIDNIFVFVLLFSFFKIHAAYYGRTLLVGILMAIVLRVIFITLGVVLVARFDWILYVFGVFLVYTGIKMFSTDQEHEFDPGSNKVYKMLQKLLPITNEQDKGRYTLTINGKRYFTVMTVVVIMLAATDIVFALDSIPAVFAITQDKLVIYTSNIFAVLGLRSLFFLLKGAINKFDYLQEGIAIVLILIGVKMLIDKFVHFPAWVSLVVIIICLGSAIVYSLGHSKKKHRPDTVPK